MGRAGTGPDGIDAEMSSSQGPSRAARIAGRYRARLASAAVLVAVSLCALVVVAAFGAALPWIIVPAALAIVLAAILAPSRGRSRPGPGGLAEAAGTAALERVTIHELADAVPEPMVLLDTAGLVLHANRAAADAFGALPAGLMLRIRFRAPEMQAMIDALLTRGEAEPIDYVERVPVERAFRVGAMPVGEGRGLYVIVFRDQSETRRIDRMRADFIANASHELRTPLASIAGFIETLRGPARDDVKARENFLAIMQRQTERMARLIDDLLSLSRLEMRTYVRPTTPVDLAGVVQQVVEALCQLARDAQVEIVADLPAAWIEVPANRDELIQVFQNLIENAIKYGGEGGRVEITLADRRREEEEEVAVTIRDHGPGIAEEHIPRITERFYRVDMEASRVNKGTGLGLAIVKHILTRHDGRLTIRSAPGEGAAFTVHLPGSVR
jgi:two-component system phosphate regulon sensor histidine kinase PhoR